MKLPGRERALVEAAKLRDYCLNEKHPRGRHKARVFATALGLKADDAEMLRIAPLRAAVQGDAVPGERGARATCGAVEQSIKIAGSVSAGKEAFDATAVH